MQIITPIKIQPLFNKILTTMDVYEEDVVKGGIIQKPQGELREYQTVLAVGDSVRNIKEGDIVAVNYMHYAKLKHDPKSIRPDLIGDNPVVEINPPVVVINNIPRLMLDDRDIDYIVVESEVEEITGPTIIEAKKPGILIS